ncbi:MAG: hypothetical protein Q9167_004074 [Letrouitia subvulpina]
MTSADPFTPLETLVLLQTLQQQDLEPPSFDSISASLKSQKILQRGENAIQDHLDAASVKTLYLRLLKEEAKIQAQPQEQEPKDQDGQINPRKRKLSSSPLDSVDQATRFNHLIPQIADRIYAVHRDETIKAIEDEERKYRRLQKDIQEIERGEWDARLQYQEVTAGRSSRGVSSIQELLTGDSRPTTEVPEKEDEQTSTTVQLDSRSEAIADPGTAAVQESQPQPATVAINGQLPVQKDLEPGKEKSAPISVEPSRHSPEEPPLQPMSPVKPTETQASVNDTTSGTSERPVQQPSIENGTALLPPPSQLHQGLLITPSSPDTQRKPPQSQANLVPSPSPRNQITIPPERPSGSPIILPPPPGMLRNSGSPSGPQDALVDAAGNPQRPNVNASSPRPPPPPPGPHPPAQYPRPPHGYPPMPYPNYDSRPPYSNIYPPYGHGYYPGYQPPPPYPYPPASPGQHSQYSNRPMYQPPVPAYPQYSPYSHNSPYPQPPPMQSPYAPLQPPRLPEPQTPTSVTASGKTKPKPSPINTSVSSTKWKNASVPTGMKPPGSPIQPRPEDISPISESAPSPMIESPPAERTTRNKRGRLTTAETPQEPYKPTPPKRGGRTRRGRGGSMRGRRVRAASSASTVMPARTRSQSLASHTDADELALEPPASSNAIKPEPATPARESSTSVPPSTTNRESGRRSTRRGRGADAVSSAHEFSASNRTGTKRKRDHIESSPSLFRAPLQPSEQYKRLSRTHILGSRTFPRTSATLINDISAHKLASIFAKPITERDAPGYHSLVYRPQDLKSIKTAISAGSKALAAASERPGMVPTGSGGEGSSVWVPKTPDVMPPKGIVNGGQLEKEICRVFADAVMFNREVSAAGKGRGTKKAGEEVRGVVGDAREMFEDVERMVKAWREAERVDEEVGLAMLSGGIDEGPGVGAGADTVSGGTKGKEKKSKENAGGEEVAVEESGAGDEEGGIALRAGKRRRR